MPNRVVYLDTETQKTMLPDHEEHRFLLGWTCYARYDINGNIVSNVWREYQDAKKLCKYISSLTRQKKPLWLIGHNIFFDLQVSGFFSYFTDMQWTIEFIHEDQVTYILVIKRGTKSIKILSSTNWFPVSLREMGQMVGLEKGEVDFDAVGRAELSKYCRRDVEILKLSMEQYYRFIRTHDLGKFSLTRASQAMGAYRHRFMGHKICVHHEEKVQKLEQDSYMGGRVECFRMGKIQGGPFVTLDINSMYPYIMRECPVPIRLLDYREDKKVSELGQTLDRFAVIAHVQIYTDIPLYGIRQDKELVFPIGDFVTTLATPMLAEALRRGHLKKIYQMAVYEQAIIFADYVDYLWGLRQRYKKEENKIYDTLAKYFANSLYGKFGQYRPIQERRQEYTGDRYYRIEHIDLKNAERWIEYKLMNTVITERGREIAPQSIMAIASHITSWGRYLLSMIMEGIGWDRVLYCDTDSVKIRKSDLVHVKYPIDPDRLGALKVESESEELEIRGAKHYRTEDVRKLKGVPHDAIEVEPDVWEYLSWPSQRYHVGEGIEDMYLLQKQIRTTPSAYTKGIVHDDGHITPYVFRI